eukprot:TRINITY_DN257_c0_g1_i4.p1 TRINITY_DN257_c0_g1~~TRINITY_DN257_c0_g1_i4.p1  ORF type:complete len:194 (-),score=44.01 TRINITY_DN257_c0_g1_i4:129-629(-)
MCIRDRVSTQSTWGLFRKMNFFGIITPPLRKRMGKSFRKRLGHFSYKMGHHKTPGIVPIHLQSRLKEEDTREARARLAKLERESPYPFGRFNRYGRFLFDPTRVPLYDVPDLEGFELKPYASFHTPKIEDSVKQTIEKLNDFNDPQNLIPRGGDKKELPDKNPSKS